MFYFLSAEADDEGGLSPGEEENESGRKIECKDAAIFKWNDYKYSDRFAA